MVAFRVMGAAMLERLGIVFYWAGIGFAIVIVPGAALLILAHKMPLTMFTPAVLIFAGGVWLTGRACMYVLARR